jgi:multidrug resistance efflux pump
MKISFANKNNNIQQNSRPAYGPTRRHIVKWQWYLVILILISPILFIFYKIIVINTDNSFHGILVYKKYAISSPANGFVKKVDVMIGSTVKKGQQLLIFDSKIIRINLKYLEKKLKLLNTRKDFITSNNDKAFNSLLKLAEGYIASTADYNKTLTDLRAKRLGTIYQVQGASMNMFTVAATKEGLEYNRYYYYVEIVNIEKEIVETENQIGQIKLQLDGFSITSPIDGEVLNQDVYENEFVGAFKPILLLSSHATPYVKAFIPPKLISGKPLRGREVEILFNINFFNNIKSEGVIVSMPSMTQTSDNDLVPDERLVFALVRVKGEIPENFRSHGYPVTLKLKKYKKVQNEQQ